MKVRFTARTRSATQFALLPTLLLVRGLAFGADSPAFAAPVAAAQGSSTPGYGRVMLSLLLVLALLLGGAWLLKRVSGLSAGTNQRIRMLANISLGARERAVLIEVDGREVLLGVAPGNVRTLLVGDAHAVVPPAATDARPVAGSTDLKSTFSEILRRSLGR